MNALAKIINHKLQIECANIHFGKRKCENCDKGWNKVSVCKNCKSIVCSYCIKIDRTKCTMCIRIKLKVAKCESCDFVIDRRICGNCGKEIKFCVLNCKNYIKRYKLGYYCHYHKHCYPNSANIVNNKN